ncbi:hypothetical protein DMUE_3531 [Dictyocoela muelleri]|nr:hypothetical protein DMUE_3531 [Dictyocoela muelleri]
MFLLTTLFLTFINSSFLNSKFQNKTFMKKIKAATNNNVNLTEELKTEIQKIINNMNQLNYQNINELVSNANQSCDGVVESEITTLNNQVSNLINTSNGKIKTDLGSVVSEKITEGQSLLSLPTPGSNSSASTAQPSKPTSGTSSNQTSSNSTQSNVPNGANNENLSGPSTSATQNTVAGNGGTQNPSTGTNNNNSGSSNTQTGNSSSISQNQSNQSSAREASWPEDTQTSLESALLPITQQELKDVENQIDTTNQTIKNEIIGILNDLKTEISAVVSLNASNALEQIKNLINSSVNIN